MWVRDVNVLGKRGECGGGRARTRRARMHARTHACVPRWLSRRMVLEAS